MIKPWGELQIEPSQSAVYDEAHFQKINYMEPRVDVYSKIISSSDDRSLSKKLLEIEIHERSNFLRNKTRNRRLETTKKNKNKCH